MRHLRHMRYMRPLHRLLAAGIAVLVVAGGLAAEGSLRTARQASSASAGGVGFGALPPSVAAPAFDHPSASTAESRSTAPLPGPPDRDAIGLQAFSGCESFLDHVRHEAVARVTPYGLPDPGGMATVDVGPVAAEPQAADGSAASFGPSSSAAPHSGTNLQEADVDEPDVVKNDGSRVFAISGQTLRAHVVGEDGMRLADTVELPAASKGELLLLGDRLVVLSAIHADGRDRTRLQTYDGANPDDLVRTSDVEVDGAYVSARAARGVVRIVTTTRPSLPLVRPANTSEEAKAEALASNQSVLQSSSVDDWIPHVRELPTDRVTSAVPCTRAHATVQFSGFNTTTVLTFDPATGVFGEAASVLSDAHEVYASIDHLYVATAAWPAETDAADEGRWPAPQETQIHQFDISEADRVAYTASGVVPGHLIRPFLWGGGSRLAQWALSEYGGHLRVANTVGEPWAGESASSVTVLRRQGSLLVPVGVVEGLGVGERIYAVRFMGDRGYVVTYRQVDPLYVLDLAEPVAPRLLGELKVPGFSAYLHPVGDGLLLGVGQEDANEDGRVEGPQVSLFDVTDPAHPRQLDRIQLGPRGSQSLVEVDHRAFTWWPDPARAVLPVSGWHRDAFVGAISVAVEDRRLRELGRVDHPLEDDAACRFPVTRSRVIGDTVYTFSSGGVWANAVGDFAPRATLRYPAGTDCHRPYEPEPQPESTTTTTTTTPGPLPLPT